MTGFICVGVRLNGNCVLSPQAKGTSVRELVGYI